MRPGRWTTADTAAGFEGFDKRLWFRLGYEPLAQELALQPEQKLLDYGCGTGTVANWLASTIPGLRVCGVDPSQHMIDRARADAVHGTEYHVLAGDRTLLANAEVDAAYAAFVLVCLPNRDAAFRLASELFRAVRPGGTVCVLDSHPDTTGLDFGGLQQGDPEVSYTAGDQMPVRMPRSDGTIESFWDTYWPTTFYQELLETVGFHQVRFRAPIFDGNGADALSPAERDRWHTALTRPPFLLVTAGRPA